MTTIRQIVDSALGDVYGHTQTQDVSTTLAAGTDALATGVEALEEIGT